MKRILVLCCAAVIMLQNSCGFDDINPGLSFEEQLAIDVALIDAYLDANQITAKEHSSGIRYVQEVIGEGASPEPGDLVVIKYDGKLLSGAFFGEDSIGVTVQLSTPTIVALQIVVPTMNVGGKTTIYSPSGYCFGNNAVGSAPKNSNLIFEIELLAIIKSPEDQLVADQNIIDEFLTERDLVAEVHESGIRFITSTVGTGNTPLASDLITVKYKGTFLNGVQFDQSTTGAQFSLPNLIEAWRLMIPTMKEGGKIEIYSPSKYCYGSTGNSSISPNTILVFEIELISID